jgi:adenosine deaminase
MKIRDTGVLSVEFIAHRRHMAISIAAMTGGLAAAGCSIGDDLDAVEIRETLVSDHLDEMLRDADGLENLLRAMPKGGDLHSHTSGAITTEKLIQWGSEDGACVHPTTSVASNPCAAGTVALTSATPGSALYQQVLGAWSMEGFTGPLLAAHQHFFDAFGKYGAIQIDSRNDDSYADVMSKAGRNKQVYIELLQGFGSGAGAGIAAGIFQPTDIWDQPTLLMRRKQIIEHPNFAPAIAAQAASIAATFSGARALLGCETSSPDPGCNVAVRLQVAANRTGSRVAVFGQWVYALELAQAVPEMVGLNLVSPEEHPNSLQFYNDEMFALGVLDTFNDTSAGRKNVHVSLHAGELIPEVVPSPVDLTFHIRRAVEVAHAERIGHGVAVLRETDGDGADDLLRDMSDAGVMVEICLTSNRVLLNAAAEDHPLNRYRREGVPVALATDDQGILRGDISDEYIAAVVDQGLGYRDLKKMVRASLEHAFVEGASLWRSRDEFRRPVDACRRDQLGARRPSTACATFLAANKRAELQWTLEGQFESFEKGIVLQ